MSGNGNGRRLFVCIALALMLCMAHVRGSTMMILGCLAAFMVWIVYVCFTDNTFPTLLFFLPWSPILRLTPDSFSFYTIALMLICAISVLKKKFRFKRYHLLIVLALLPLTLLTKMLNGSMITFDYISFLLLLLMFPVVKEEWLSAKYDFFHIVTYFSIGIIIAALAALSLTSSANIAKFIRVDEYLTIVRRCGFYGDANFYTAQVTAALGGCLMELLKDKKPWHMILLFGSIVFLLYCGFLSGSKSFVIITLIMLVLWIIGLFRLKGRTVFKVVVITVAVITAIFIATSVLFKDLLAMMDVRFSFDSNLSEITTGRTDVWSLYLKELRSDWKMLLLGNGYTNIRIGEKYTHNTLLQMVFQLGLIGTPILFTWSGYFFADRPSRGRKMKREILCPMMLAVGAFFPWLAIDALFFDEFFLLQMYVYLGCRRIERGDAPRVQQIADGTITQPEGEVEA